MNIIKNKDCILLEPAYDFIVVGSGITGCTIAQALADNGFHVLVVEKRPNIGGNCYDEVDKETGVRVHKYGAHIFRTSSLDIWNYTNNFCHMMPYNHKVLVNFQDRLYSFPINFMTVHALFPETVRTPEDMHRFINKKKNLSTENPNLEEHCIFMIGKTLYDIFIKGYTKKQWGKDPKDLPASIIKRIPVRYTANDYYFADDKIYQGIPEDGYTGMMEKMLSEVDVILNTDFLKDREFFEKICKRKIIYTGAIDDFFGIEGKLEWRSLLFEDEIRQEDMFQATSVVNYTDEKIPWTRIIEHKHFSPWMQTNGTYITKEYPQKWIPGQEKYYPVPTESNLYKVALLKKRIPEKYVFAGRLALYKYIDMDVAIEHALEIAKNLYYDTLA